VKEPESLDRIENGRKLMRGKGKPNGYIGGKNVREKSCILGLVSAMRAAPAARFSSPGYLTIVK